MIHLTVQQLSASLDGALTGPSLELVVRHLAACHDCRDRQVRLAKHDDALRRLLAQEPKDLFMDDLTRRAESLVTAIARGVPAPIMVTSVPLLHEEDPYAPVEPPPLPPRPELGRSGEIAKEAGWGRIGLKPTASTHAPQSDPEEAQRLLEALASGETDDFTELTAEGLQEHAPMDGPVFDLPAWIKDQSARGTRRAEGPREVPKLSLFFEELTQSAAGMTREAAEEIFRRREAEAADSVHEGSLAPDLDAYEQPNAEGVPPEHAAYAPPGWGVEAAPEHGEAEQAPPEPDAHAAPAWEPEIAPPELHTHAHTGWNTEASPTEWDTEPARPEEAAYPSEDWNIAPPPAGWDSEPAQPEAPAYASSEWRIARPPAGWNAEPARFGQSNPSGWNVDTITPASLDPGAWTQPLTHDFDRYPGDGVTTTTRTAPARGLDRAVVLALASVGAFILILLALQLVPAPRKPAAQTTPSSSSVTKPPRKEPPHQGGTPTEKLRTRSQARTAATRPALDQAVPPVVAEREHSAPAIGESAPADDDEDFLSQPALEPDLGSVSPPNPSKTPVKPGLARTAAAQPARPATKTPSSATAATTTNASSAPAEDAQWPLLCGLIEDDMGQPVFSARVSMSEISFATRTDARGRFCMSAPPGAHNLFIEASGFTPQRVAVISSASSADLRIKLQPAR